MLPNVGKLNSAYSAFSNFHSTFIRAIGSVSYQVLSFENSPWAGLGQILGRCLCNHRKTLTKVQKVTFVENKDAVSAQLSNCNVATRWQVELSILSLLQLSFNIFIRAMGSVVPSSSFIGKQPLGWPWANLGALLVQPQKNTDVQCLPLPVFPGRLS